MRSTVALLILCLALTGCQSWQSLAQDHQLRDTLVDTGLFTHRILLNNAGVRAQQAPSTDSVLWHVYIEGDGRPVTENGHPSRDPTPHQLVLLPVMAKDPEPAIYLGRPCYFATGDQRCNPADWTLERYSNVTVDSLKRALLTQIHPQDGVVLIGHSGGGTLAMLLAPRLPMTRAVITLAGNLDVGAWVAANHYTPLPDCLDPAQQPPLPPHIRQWHFAGSHDDIIKPEWIQAVSRRQPNARFILVKSGDHHHPWSRLLPQWLRQHKNALDSL